MLLTALFLISCHETIDLRDEVECIDDCCLVEGTLTFKDGSPLCGEKVRATALQSSGFLSSTTLKFAETKTNSRGDFSLEYMLDSESKAELVYIEVSTSYYDSDDLCSGRAVNIITLIPSAYTPDSVYRADQIYHREAKIELQLLNPERLTADKSVRATVTAHDIRFSCGRTHTFVSGEKTSHTIKAHSDTRLEVIATLSDTSNATPKTVLEGTFELKEGEKRSVLIEL